jgi:UDP-N-acetylmuramoylalanine--D-glutamate ligase
MSTSTTTTTYRHQRVLVVGLGLHGGGAATAAWLASQGAQVRVIDRQPRSVFRDIVPTLRRHDISYHFGSHRASDWRWAERIVVNPAVPLTLPEVRAAARRGVPIDNEASLYVRHQPGTLIGVTGTRGKTTTTTLLGSILRTHHRATIISGNVREVPMLAYLPRVTPTTWSVLELSSYQLEHLPVPGQHFRVAILTNLKRDHLDRHGTFANYGRQKLHLFAGQTATDVAILNADDPYCRRSARSMTGRIMWFGLTLPARGEGVTLRQSWIVVRRTGRYQRVLPLSDWSLPGQHNLANLMAAVAAALDLNVPVSTIRRTVRSFRGVPHRQESLGVFGGHEWINDTAATSPDGTLAALDVYPRGLFIVGGTDKHLDFRLLARTLIKRQLPIIVLPGTGTQQLLRLGGSTWPLIVRAWSMAGAVAAAQRLAAPGQVIVLSPGAASFGLFRHEFHRGEEFRRFVQARS